MALLEYICRRGWKVVAQSPWVEICAIVKTAWPNNFGTVSKMLVAAVEHEKDAIAHEIVKSRQTGTQHQSAEFWGNFSGPTSFATAAVSHCTISSQDHVRPWEPVAVPKLQFSCNRSTAWKNQCCDLVTTTAIGVRSIGKTTMAPK